jgi:hypothetical protein
VRAGRIHWVLPASSSVPSLLPRAGAFLGGRRRLARTVSRRRGVPSLRFAWWPRTRSARAVEQFSDGVGYSWIDGLKAFTEQQVIQLCVHRLDLIDRVASSCSVLIDRVAPSSSTCTEPSALLFLHASASSSSLVLLYLGLALRRHHQPHQCPSASAPPVTSEFHSPWSTLSGRWLGCSRQEGAR